MSYTYLSSRFSLRMVNMLLYSILLLILFSACSAGDVIFGSNAATPTSTSAPTPAPAPTPTPIPTSAPTTSSGGQPISQTIDPCSVITVEEAAQVFGGPMRSDSTGAPRPILTVQGGTEYISSCIYGATQPPARGFAFNLEVASDPASAKAVFQRFKTTDIGTRDINRLGEEAYYSSQNLLYVRKDNVVFFFLVVGTKDPTTILREAQQLAKYALTRL